MARLKGYAAIGEAKRLTEKHYRRHTAGEGPSNPLLFVPRDTARAPATGLAVAGIAKDSPGQGVLDFHCLRTTYVSLVIESGASVKEAMTLARHSTPNLTLNVYARARQERLEQVAAKMRDWGIRLTQVHPRCCGPQSSSMSASSRLKSVALSVAPGTGSTRSACCTSR